MANTVVSNIIKVKPCKTIDEVIKSNDFKSVLNIIFRELAKHKNDTDWLLELSEIKNALDKLLSDKPISGNEWKIINIFLNQALDRTSLIYKKIDKVLSRVEAHSFLDTFFWILHEKHDLTNDIVKNKNINPVIIALFKKINELLDWKISDVNTDVKIKISEILDKESQEIKIINQFFELDYEPLMEIIRKARNWKWGEKIPNFRLFVKIIKIIVTDKAKYEEQIEEFSKKAKVINKQIEELDKEADEKKKKINKKQIEKLNKEIDKYNKIKFIFSFIINTDCDVDNKIINILNHIDKKIS